MCPNKLPQRQRGLGLMAAIFVITIMAVIVVGLANLVVGSKESYGYEIMSVRAFMLAESGGQMALSQLALEGASDCSGLAPTLPGAGFQGCTLALSCPSVTINTVEYFTITVEASCGSGVDQAIRRLRLGMQR